MLVLSGNFFSEKLYKGYVWVCMYTYKHKGWLVNNNGSTIFWKWSSFDLLVLFEMFLRCIFICSTVRSVRIRLTNIVIQLEEYVFLVNSLKYTSFYSYFPRRVQMRMNCTLLCTCKHLKLQRIQIFVKINKSWHLSD